VDSDQRREVPAVSGLKGAFRKLSTGLFTVSVDKLCRLSLKLNDVQAFA
jgi:hypothetical protein